MKKFVAIISSVLVFTLMSSSVFAFAMITDTFPDVDENTDYYESIYWMAENGVINGHPDGTFKPDHCVNRAEMLKMLFETTGEDLEDMAAGGGAYPDVYPDEWYFLYIKKASIKGIVSGYPDGWFRPEQCVNRVEAIKMGINEFDIEFKHEDLGWGWADLYMDEWYFEYVFTSLLRNLVGLEHVYTFDNGTMANQYFSPADPMSRKEAAEMLYRMKALVDNGAEVYDETLVPNPIP
ncbi:S-layer homology domain-containing protein [Patescibacteria group bacterium]